MGTTSDSEPLSHRHKTSVRAHNVLLRRVIIITLLQNTTLLYLNVVVLPVCPYSDYIVHLYSSHFLPNQYRNSVPSIGRYVAHLFAYGMTFTLVLYWLSLSRLWAESWVRWLWLKERLLHSLHCLHGSAVSARLPEFKQGHGLDDFKLGLYFINMCISCISNSSNRIEALTSSSPFPSIDNWDSEQPSRFRIRWAWGSHHFGSRCFRYSVGPIQHDALLQSLLQNWEQLKCLYSVAYCLCRRRRPTIQITGPGGPPKNKIGYTAWKNKNWNTSI